MRIGIANDHAATEMKFAVKKYLEDKGYEVVNYGTDSTGSYDYPIAGETLGRHIMAGDVDLGIAICGTGGGISIACNKVKGIRAVCCSDVKTAGLIREHNNAQIIAFGARIIDNEQAFKLVDAFLNTPFSNGERHNRRIAMIHEIEER